jgi:hypothetical protein
MQKKKKNRKIKKKKKNRKNKKIEKRKKEKKTYGIPSHFLYVYFKFLLFLIY